jgi:hypothetical protein
MERSMSRNYYSEINLHLTWHCKDSLPLLTPQVEAVAHRCVKQKIVNTPGVFVHEIADTKDLEWVTRYIRQQREHHACGKLQDRLERITELEA